MATLPVHIPHDGFPPGALAPGRRRTAVLRIKIMLAGPAALTGIIAELFDDRPEFEVVAFAPGLRGLARDAARVMPDLIVAHVKPIGTDVCRAVESIKRSSPRSKLVVICAVPEFIEDARKCGADACIDEEQLIAELLPIVETAIGRPGSVSTRRGW